MIIAIDGPSGSGKSSVSIGVAQRLGLSYLDTGAIYRALTVAGGVPASQVRITTDAAPARVWLGEREISEEIRTPETTSRVSNVAAKGEVRAWVGEFIAALRLHDAVIEGRDIATVIAPDAELKIFLTAAESVRANRRANEWSTSPAQALVAQRDEVDSQRALAPLTQASDAIVIDSTAMSISEVVDEIVRLAKEIA